MQTVQSSAHKSLTVVETTRELDLHADTCVIGDKCLVAHDHNSPVNVYEYDPKVVSKHAYKVGAMITFSAQCSDA